MMLHPIHRIRSLRLVPAMVMLALLAGCTPRNAEHASASAPGDPWTAVKLIPPAELATELADSTAVKPLLLHVGFRALYHGGAIPGSHYAGPGSRPDGLEALRQAVKDEPKDRSIVIYCGCCPWKDCPNMKPAAREMAALGFTHVRAMKMDRNFDTDWAGHGYPVEQPKD